MLKARDKEPENGYNLFHQIHYISKSFEDIDFKLIYRKTNQSSDMLAKQSSLSISEVFKDSSRWLQHLLVENLFIYFVRQTC